MSKPNDHRQTRSEAGCGAAVFSSPMAEARREEAEELRDIRNRNQATDRTERNKSEALHSSQGPLSSIRAAIKRTRTSTQSEQTRDRRRPEITILSAEPFAANGWLPGASGGFTAALPTSQPIWGGSIQSDTQVIKEKTQETVVTLTATRRRSTTIATQTDPVEDDTAAGPECTASSQPIEKRQSTVKIKPKKPPRPYLPKPLQSDSTTAIAVSDSGLIQVDATATNTKNQTDPKSAAAQPSPTDVSCAIPNTRSLTPSVSVQWDGPIIPSEPSTITTFLEPTVPSSSVPVATERPIPLPRSKSCKQTITEEVKVQTLVRLSDSGSSSVDDTAVEAPPSGKYLQELLDVFCPVDLCDQNTSDNQTPTDVSDQSEEGDEDGDMAALHSQRNIRARIQAFESQEGDGEPEFKQPEPLPRNVHLKPPVISAKPAPALAPKPSIKKPSNGNNYQGAISIFSTPFIPSIPTPAPRPMLHRKPSIVPEPKEPEPEAPPPAKTALLSRSRLSIAARAKNLFPQEEDEPRLVPPISPEKPRKEPLGLNLNNHNSASITTTEAVNEYMDNPTNYIPVNPVRSDVGGGSSFSRQTVTRRPTTIRVPSKGNLFDGTLDNPPPLPAQKPVGSLPSSVTRKQSISTRFPFQESFDSEPIPGLPPRPGGTKVLPPRPPPAKVGPGRPPPPRINGPRQSLSTRRAPASSAAPSPKQPQAQKPKKKGPVLPPRPNPGHCLYNQYTLGLPHGIAEFDYSGRDTGELSFQKNQLLLLIEQLDHKTFECQVGDIRGRVQKSHMKVITPLSSAPTKPALSQGVSTVGSRRDSSGLQVQVLHDFTPEGPGELGLREGDVVTNVEQVDSEWYRGSCRGSSGFFPVSYVKVMSNAPTLTNTKKARPPPATVSGPRCVARFDFEGEQSDELTFSEGDVIQLKEYMEEEWARGQIGAHTGIFPINFVDIIEDLPPPPQPQQSFPTKMALPAMVSSTKTQEAAKPIQSGSSGVEWAVALYDFVGQAEEELSFQQGDRILVTQHVDAEWCSGRLNGREGFFPTAFVETSSGNSPVLDRQQSVTNGEGSRGKALFDFTAECEEELSLKAGDIITNVESIDDEWFLGELRGKRALVPKNYMQVLA
ncbi:SH3 domain-containing protein 19 isoform X2 [Oncorhynchus keta]|uniref:SH3 domain-containing protein 19 isoform X2 n=1 Tax=Oncorhynchus keta TaxID=8018 RepID=UPI00227AB14C|nr:SH3 domain-containing protein 19 isoform X2 [Oncorhynchus keta]